MSQYYISHHGIEGQKWGVRNGPPYPLKESLSTRVGRKRAIKRGEYIEKKTKGMIASTNLNKQLSSLKMEDLRRQANDILESDERLESFGRQTIINRAAVFGTTHVAALGYAYLAAASSMPIFLAGSAVAAGSSWIYYYYSRR